MPFSVLQYTLAHPTFLSLVPLNPTDGGFKWFPNGAAELGFLLLECTSRLAPWNLLLGCKHYLYPLASCCLPGVAMGLWDGQQGLGLHTHLLAVLAGLAVPPLLALSTCRRGTLLPPPPVTKSHSDGCVRARVVDPGNTH